MRCSTSTPTALLTVSNLHSSYGPIQALKGVNITINRGEIVTILGSNGAGKTTMLMSISGIVKAQAGTITFDGQEITGLAGNKVVALGLSQVPEGRKIFTRMSVLENMQLGGYLRSDKRSVAQDFEKCFALFPILAERRHQSAGTLSGGEQQMLAICRALMSRPKMLLLDEPSMGVAPLLVAKIFETLELINKEGMTILLVEQNAHLALKVASRGYVIETGQITLHDSSTNLLNDSRVKEAYLGE